MVEKMTEEQRMLAEKHYDLIFSFMSKHGYDPEEFYGDAAIGLCQAAMYYRPESGNAFSTYAYTCMHHQCLMKIRSETKKSCCLNVISMEEALHDDSTLRLLDTISSDAEDLYATTENVSAIMKKMKERLSLRELQIILMRLNGKTQGEIAGVLGCSTQNVSLVMKKIKSAMSVPYRPVRKKLGDDGMRSVFLQLIVEAAS